MSRTLTNGVYSGFLALGKTLHTRVSPTERDSCNQQKGVSTLRGASALYSVRRNSARQTADSKLLTVPDFDQLTHLRWLASTGLETQWDGRTRDGEDAGRWGRTLRPNSHLSSDTPTHHGLRFFQLPACLARTNPHVAPCAACDTPLSYTITTSTSVHS